MKRGKLLKGVFRNDRGVGINGAKQVREDGGDEVGAGGDQDMAPNANQSQSARGLAGASSWEQLRARPRAVMAGVGKRNNAEKIVRRRF